MSELQPYQADLIDKAMSVGALKFGTFTLKSGREAPYFFNSGLLNTGPIISALAKAFASTIVNTQLESENPIPQFDVLFGPAYKGIPLAAMTVMELFNQHQVSVGLAYDRKEVKDHGEGGNMVGVSVAGKRVVVLDDVMTSGKAVRGSIELIGKQGGEVVGVVQCLDREEVGRDGVGSAVKEVEGIVGKGRVKAILKMRDLMMWLAENKMEDELVKMRAYWDRYGLNK
ncbi:hypothetical protein E1B28_003147 [Marasmius oreades]|uniref:orotate phosphoribosyltransferase n=1 Tax=Marasmius oreades TaxID=181124 RepID=A0A9P7RLU5_9AGAR|nr:uncharacterized protein E1B28_003147 [Marasmius oreades]KAG7085596.1 hypothetical protein E1B28_003147 [Marasmius oreades]